MASSVDIVPALGTGLVVSQVGPSGGYDAIDIRRGWLGPERGEGVATYESFRVVQRVAGANMSVDVGMDERVYVRGDSVALQGLYCVAPHASTINVDVTAANGSNPRLDMVVLEVKDDAHDVGGLNKARVKMVDGTASSGATLDNRTGAAALPASCLLLADVLVATSDTSITTAEIRDRRPFIAGIPPLLTAVDMAGFHSAPSLTLNAFSAAPLDLMQSAALVYLPRRIVSATRIRWRYKQGATALTGNYLFAVHDSSGRKIIDTGSVAFTGATITTQTRSETITASTFEAGLYYVLFGVDTTNAGTIETLTWHTGGGGLYIPYPNVGVTSPTGGVTAPATLAAFAESNFACDVPVCALSVG